MSPLLASIIVLTSLGKDLTKPNPNSTSTQGQAANTRSTDAHAQVPTKWSGKLILLTNIPTVRLKVKVYSRTGYHLVVLPGGHVTGTVNASITSKYGRFELHSYAPSVIRMKSIATQRYVGITRTGRVFSTKEATNETLLNETQRENYFHSFHSHIYKHKDMRHWYLAIKQNGKMKNARRVKLRHKSFQFLTIEEGRKETTRQKLEKLAILELLRNVQSSP